MATVNFKVFKHHVKSDGTVNVKLVIYHNKKYAYPDTTHFVDISHLNRKYKIKDRNLLHKLAKELISYRDKIGSLGSKLSIMTPVEVGEYLLHPKIIESGSIDIIDFGRRYISTLRARKENGKAGVLNTSINNLIDYFKNDIIYTQDITYQFLVSYDAFLRSDRIQVRSNMYGNYESVKKGLDDGGVNRALTNLNSLFIEARNNFNDESTGNIRIPHNPFKKYKLPKSPDPEHRDLPIETVILIRDLKCRTGGRMELARDMFMLSFYLCGINAADIYLITEITNGRIEYYRQKTKGRRADKAFMSVRVVDEARPLLERWIGKLPDRYSHSTGLNKAIANGLKQVASSIGVDKFDFYSARHTVATEARNRLGYSTEDVGEILNHNQKRSATRSYIKKDWKKIDEIQAKVVALLGTV